MTSQFSIIKKKSFSDASNKGKFSGLSLQNSNGTISKKINVTFIVNFSLVNTASV